MTIEEFWDDVGWMHEESNEPCEYCVVKRYERENKNYKKKCSKDCATAIQDVYNEIKGKGM